jgi:hypothetical protein
MSLLVYITEENKRIIYEGKEYYTSLLYVYSHYDRLYMVFPRMLRGLRFIELDDEYKKIRFQKTYVIGSEYHIYYD